MTLRRINKDIRELIYDAVRRNTPRVELERRIATLLRRSGFDAALLDAIYADAIEKYVWIKSNNAPVFLRDAASEILVNTKDIIRSIGKKLPSILADNVVSAYKTGTKKQIFIDKITKKYDLADYKSFSLVDTTFRALDRTQVISNALDAGVEYFELTGASPERRWCKDHHKKTFKIDEIRDMDNGQGLTVLYYAGGYRCVHKWREKINYKP